MGKKKDEPAAAVVAEPVYDAADAQEAPAEHHEAEIMAPKFNATSAIAKGLPATPECVERVNEAIEALSGFSQIALPLVRFKDGFRMSEDGEEIDSFLGVIVFQKESNIYYKARYQPGKIVRPDCFSPDGKIPTVEKPIAPKCSECALNKYGSAPQGDGKACKNTRPIFMLTQTAEGSLGVIPRVLRVPPTSLGLIKQYTVNIATDFGAYYGVLTKFEVFKKADNQTHNNIKFSFAGRLDAQQKADVQFVRNGWMTHMSQGNFGMDEDTAHEPTRPAATPSDPEAPTF